MPPASPQRRPALLLQDMHSRGINVLQLMAASSRRLVRARRAHRARVRTACAGAPAGERAAFRGALHAALVRLACGGAGAALAPAVTALLAAHLGCHAVGPPARRVWLAAALDDVVDALEAAGPDGARTAALRNHHDSASRACAVAAHCVAGRAGRVAVRLRKVHCVACSRACAACRS